MKWCGSLLLASCFLWIGCSLRINQVQMLGSHNSYHLPSNPTLPDWNYTHRPLTEQFDLGIRNIELDIHLDDDDVSVHHIDIFDTNTTCATLDLCLQEAKNWSDAHLYHYPIIVFIEAKTAHDFNATAWTKVDNLITSIIPKNRLITPNDIMKNSKNLRTAIEGNPNAWPEIDVSRGKFIFVVSGDHDDYAKEPFVNYKGRIMFPLQGINELTDDSSFFSTDDIELDKGNISSLVRRNFIVRTRADVSYFPGAAARSAQSRYSDFFYVLDRNHDGIVSLEEFQTIFMVSGRNVPLVFISAILAGCGTNVTLGADLNQTICVVGVADQTGSLPEVKPPMSENAENIRRNLTLESWSTIIATDYPYPGGAFVVQVPGTTPELPVRCNIRLTGSECRPACLEAQKPETCQSIEMSTGMSTSATWMTSLLLLGIMGISS